MNAEQFAAYLVETEETDPLLKNFLDRLLLRIFDTPSLMSSLLDVNIASDEDGFKVQLDFKKIPDEIVPSLRQVVGPYNTRALAFQKDGVNHTGLEVNISREELNKASKIALVGHPDAGGRG